MALTLRVTDNADGTGGTATVGGTSGAAVSVYGRAFANTYDTHPWEPTGSRAGDGSLALALTPGFWWGYAETAADRSPVLGLRVTANPIPLVTRARDAVEAALRLAVPPEFVGRVTVQFRFNPAGTRDKPCVTLSADGLGETVEPDTSQTDLLGVPVLVTAAILEGMNDPAALRATDALRQAVIDLFHLRRAPGLAESARCTVEAVALDPADPRTMGVTTGQLVRVYCRNPRPGGLA